MADTYSSKLQLWDGRAIAAVESSSLAAVARPPFSPDCPDRLFALEALAHPHSRGPDGVEPYSLQWFLDAERLRHERYARWLPSVLEFGKHAGETLLGMGPGLGTEWVQYARQGACVIACSPSAEQLALVRRHFELRELPARFLQAESTKLPLDPASIDVVCLTDLLHHVGDPQALLDEVYRVLKPGGKVLAMAPAHFDIDFWSQVLLPWRWAARAGEATGVLRHTKRSLRAVFHRFSEHRIHKRHLRRADVPHLWRLLPTNMLQRMLGRLLILKAFKPLSSAIPATPLAA